MYLLGEPILCPGDIFLFGETPLLSTSSPSFMSESGGTFSFALSGPKSASPSVRLFFLLNLRCFNTGLGFFGVSSSNEMTKPLEGSAVSLSTSVFMFPSVSASSSVILFCTVGTEAGPDNELAPLASPAPRLLSLNVEEMVGRVVLAGDGGDVTAATQVGSRPSA